MDQVCRGKDHVRRAVVLAKLLVHIGLQRQGLRIRQFVCRKNVRPHRGRRVEVLARSGLVEVGPIGTESHLPLARSHVVQDGITEYVVQRPLASNVPAPLSNYDRELHLVVEFFGDAGIALDPVIRTDHRPRGLEKVFRLTAGKRRLVLLVAVVLVVATAREN